MPNCATTGLFLASSRMRLEQGLAAGRRAAGAVDEQDHAGDLLVLGELLQQPAAGRGPR